MKHYFQKQQAAVAATGTKELKILGSAAATKRQEHNYYQRRFDLLVWGVPLSDMDNDGNDEATRLKYRHQSMEQIFALFDGVTHEAVRDVAIDSPWNQTHNIRMNSVYKKFLSNILTGRKGLSQKFDPLIPVDLELEIDGTSAIFPGNAFQSSYIPTRYRNMACFQVTGVDHKVDSSGWSSTLRSQIRVSIPMQEEEMERKKGK